MLANKYAAAGSGEKLALVFNNNMGVLGGGERSTLTYAYALQKLGFTVEIITRNDVPDSSVITRVFGAEFAGIPVRQVKEADIHAHAKARGPEVFVNHNFNDMHRNAAKVGIYSQMFPMRRISTQYSPGEHEKLLTYRMVLSNSTFTKSYTDELWEFPREHSHVVHPPIGEHFSQLAGELLINAPQKKRQFVNVGRFNPGMHNKNQLILIERFLAARKRFAELADWSLVLIGNANTDPASRAYFSECESKAAASNGAVRILPDASNELLSQTLLESYGYVHGTGAFLGPREAPHRCEHFGLSIIEAMAHGCIPLVYARGGIFDVLVPGDMGIPYATPEGLEEGFVEVASTWNSETGITMQRLNLAAARNQRLDTFVSRLSEVLTAEGVL
jgi:glycosyltransferase involved in cell wall biosynthesis